MRSRDGECAGEGRLCFEGGSERRLVRGNSSASKVVSVEPRASSTSTLPASGCLVVYPLFTLLQSPSVLLN